MLEPKKVSKRKIDLFGSEDSESDSDEIVTADNGANTSSTGVKSKPNSKKPHSEEEINAFRNRLQIKAKGNSVPDPAATFSDMEIFPDLKPIIIANIEESRWKDPTPIQMQAITVMLKGILSLEYF